MRWIISFRAVIGMNECFECSVSRTPWSSWEEALRPWVLCQEQGGWGQCSRLTYILRDTVAWCHCPWSGAAYRSAVPSGRCVVLSEGVTVSGIHQTATAPQGKATMKRRSNTKPLGSVNATLTPLLCTLSFPVSALYANCGGSMAGRQIFTMFVLLERIVGEQKQTHKSQLDPVQQGENRFITSII